MSLPRLFSLLSLAMFLIGCTTISEVQIVPRAAASQGSYPIVGSG